MSQQKTEPQVGRSISVLSRGRRMTQEDAELLAARFIDDFAGKMRGLASEIEAEGEASREQQLKIFKKIKKNDDHVSSLISWLVMRVGVPFKQIPAEIRQVSKEGSNPRHVSIYFVRNPQLCGSMAVKRRVNA